MAREIERRFLVIDDRWRAGAAPTTIRQGYLSTAPERVVRVRLADDRAFLTVKGASQGPSRPEFEYAVPLADAREMLALCGSFVVEKTRWRVVHEGAVWDVDEFSGANKGLILAEIELIVVDQALALPPWVGREITDDHRYANVCLAVRPFATWPGSPGPSGSAA